MTFAESYPDAWAAGRARAESPPPPVEEPAVDVWDDLGGTPTEPRPVPEPVPVRPTPTEKGRHIIANIRKRLRADTGGGES